MTSRRLRPLVLAACAAVAMSFGACNTTAVQCLSEEECLSKGPEFENTTCDPNTKTCVKAAGAAQCSTNAECIAANGNQAAICRKSDKKCVPLQTAECPDVISAGGPQRIADDRTIIIGYMGLQNAAAFGVQHLRAAALAQADFVTQVKGLPSVDGSGQPRPVVIAACNETLVGDNGLTNGGKHLVNDLQVPIIIGPIDTASIAVVQAQVTGPTNTMMVTTNVGGGGPKVPAPLYWGLTAGRETFLAAVLDNLKELEARAVAKGIKAAGDPLRVLLIEEATSSGSATTQAILNKYTFDGKIAAQHDRSTFRLVNMGNPIFDPITSPAPNAEIAQNVLPAAYELKPHIILHGGQSGAFPPYVIQAIEDSWDKATGGAPRPLYFSPTPGTAATLGLVLPIHPSLLTRVYVELDIPSGDPVDPGRVVAFTSRFEKANPDVPPITATSSIVLFNAYDAVYFSEFVLAAIGNAPLTGTNAANAARRLAGAAGERIRDQPDQIQKGFDVLGRGGNITLDGLGGVFEFDGNTGSPPGAAGIFCMAIENGNLAPKSSGVSYDGKVGHQGTWNATACP